MSRRVRNALILGLVYMKKVLSVLLFFYLFPINLFAWTNGELLIWMDPERGRALDPIVQKFDTDFGVKVTIETPENHAYFPDCSAGRQGARHCDLGTR